MSNLPTLSDLMLLHRDRDSVIGLRDFNQSVSWGEFYDDVIKLSRALHSNSSEECILCCLDPYRFAVGLVALASCGVDIVIPPNLQPDTVVTIAGRGQGWVIDDAFYDKLVRESYAGDVNLSAPDKEVKITMYTSGSSGEPVAVIKTMAGLAAEINTFQRHWGSRVQGGLFVSSVAHYHAYGFCFHILWPLCAGEVILFKNITYPEAIFEYAGAYNINFISSPAFLNQQLYSFNTSKNADFDFLRFVTSAGSRLPIETAKEMAAILSSPVVEIYGSTETGAVATRSVPSDPAGDDYPWTCLHSVKVQQGENGYLSVLTPFASEDGLWMDIADHIDFLEDGRFFLRGRGDRIVKIFEKRVSLTHLEKICEESSLVHAAKAVFIEDSGRLGCVVVLSKAGLTVLRADGRRILVEKLREHLYPSFDLVVLPKKWRFVDAFPQNDMGKIQAAALLKLFARDEIDAGPYTEHYEIKDLSSGDRTASATLFLPDNLLYFDGHFDEVQILPGVVQVDWAIRFAREHLGVIGDFLSIDNLKFMRVIRPGSFVDLRVECNDDKSIIEFLYTSSNEKHSSGKVRFER